MRLSPDLLLPPVVQLHPLGVGGTQQTVSLVLHTRARAPGRSAVTMYSDVFHTRKLDLKVANFFAVYTLFVECLCIEKCDILFPQPDCFF